jgi:lipopolysaccharide export LptBFGC system permease protein LptF
LRKIKDQLVAKYKQRESKNNQPPKKIIPTIKVNKTPIIPIVPQHTYALVDDNAKTLLLAVDSSDYNPLITESINKLSNDRDELLTLKNINFDYNRLKQKHLLRLNQQMSWAAICVIFLFIGAPLGSIIRKGGYGYPMLVAILFYMIFIITTIFGEKLVKNGTMGGIQAAWLPCVLLSPFAILLTVMALRDMRFHFLWLNNLKRFLPKKADTLTSPNP